MQRRIGVVVLNTIYKKHFAFLVCVNCEKECQDRVYVGGGYHQ